MKCEQCGNDYQPKKKRSSRFCSNACRTAWHRNNSHPGVLAGLRQLRSGAWSAIVHYTKQPSVTVGTRVRLETD